MLVNGKKLKCESHFGFGRNQIPSFQKRGYNAVAHKIKLKIVKLLLLINLYSRMKHAFF